MSGRTEQAGIEFPAATWMSFDGYSRYAAIARTLQSVLPEGARVLDVGDSFGFLRVVAPSYDVVTCDLDDLRPEPWPGTRRLKADGRALPFADAAFDAVVTSDVLEHVPGDDRAAFLAECARVTRDLLVVAAPFDTPGVAGCEELIRRYSLFAFGAEQTQLEEHRERGLPDLDAARQALEAVGLAVTVAGNGNLADWFLMMVLKHQILRYEVLTPLNNGYDVLYNMAFAGRNGEPPFYRHLLVARRGEPVAVPPDPVATTPPLGDVQVLLGAAIAAHATEIARQEQLPREDEALVLLRELHDRVAGLEHASAGLAGELAAVATDVTGIKALLHNARHPLQTARRKLSRADGSA